MKLNLLKLYIAAVISTIQNACAYQSPAKQARNPTPYHDWDYLMYSQRWPVTSCAQWEASAPDNKCSLPPDKGAWIVHGIWPTKAGTEGPFFCPSAVHFDPDQVAPLLPDLQARWTNVEANTQPYSFWKHEWQKHGTCAVTLPALDSVSNFFNQGLQWNEQYKLAEMLAKSEITPCDSGYTPEQIYAAVKSVIQVDPMIQCVVDRHTKESMISEIRICFNKTFGLIDCDRSSPGNKVRGGAVIGNCDLKKPVMYLDQVPSRDESFEMDYIDNMLRQHYDDQVYYVKMYRLLKFLIWFST